MYFYIDKDYNKHVKKLLIYGMDRINTEIQKNKPKKIRYKLILP